MKKILLFLIFSGFQIFAYSQNFEGRIYFQKQTISDTAYYTYNIKNGFIRIDEYNRMHELQKSVIFDLEKRTIVALNPHKKLYTHLAPPKTRNSNDAALIIKSNNYRIINGYKCYQWRVKNVEKNTEVAYWVAQHEFKCFDQLLSLWHSKDSNLDFFLDFPETKGYLPMLSVERTLLRDEKTRLAILQIEKEKIDDSLFQIPSSYKLFDNRTR